MQPLTAALKHEALRLGFATAGVCAATPSAEYPRLLEWLERGYAGEMSYLERRREAYASPAGVLPGARSLLVLTIDYATSPAETATPGAGRVSRYAWGERDYHDLIHERLHALADWLREQAPAAQVRGVVDTAPLLERDYARLAGLGWLGKHTLLIRRPGGSYCFLAALLTDLELSYDEPFATDHCGTCQACLDACPTDAFPAPHVLDATRCISYLTIEHRGPIPTALREGLGDWVFGCDVCQDVCPWNRRAPASNEPSFAPRAGSNPLELLPLFELDEPGFRAQFRGTPLWRTGRAGLLRNAAIVLGNQRLAAAIPALAHGLIDDSPLVRGACAWALRQIGGDMALEALRRRADVETDADVMRELVSGGG